MNRQTGALTSGVLGRLLVALPPGLGQGKTVTPTITLLARTYHLGSFNQKSNPQWEFVTGNDTVGKAKIFLDQHSGEVGRALANAVLPDIGTLPRKEF